MPMK